MAKNKGRNTYQIQDLLKDGGIKGNTPKPKIGYVDWLKGGGWKPVTIAAGVILLIGYARSEIKHSSKRENYKEARLIMEQGITPTKPVNKNLFKDDEQHQFGQSMMKDEKIK
jgi:hypothetical protein